MDQEGKCLGQFVPEEGAISVPMVSAPATQQYQYHTSTGDHLLRPRLQKQREITFELLPICIYDRHGACFRYVHLPLVPWLSHLVNQTRWHLNVAQSQNIFQNHQL